MKIHEHGYWMNETAEGHGHDEGLAKALVGFFEDNNFYDRMVLDIMDIGCGDGYYTNYITDNGDNLVCTGVDGNPYTKEIAGSLCYVADLTKPLPFLFTNDWVLCLEVGEHIPPEYEDIFISNLDKQNKFGMVLSWAVRGQGGDGHVNCKNNNEIIEKISNLGYTLDNKATQTLRNSVAEYPTPCYWFRNTLMVFRKNVSPETCSLGFDMGKD